MRKLRVFIIFTVLAIMQTHGAAEDTFYYRNGKKVPLKLNPSKQYVLLEPKTTKKDLVESLGLTHAVMRRFESTTPLKNMNLVHEPETLNWAIVDNIDLKASPLEKAATAGQIRYTAPFVQTASGKDVGLSHLFYVKLKKEGDRKKLEDLARKYKVTIVGNNKFMPLWYTLSCTTSSVGNSLDVANGFYESKQFTVAEPDFMADFRIQSANDQHFPKQWGLENSGQHGGSPPHADINACDAWKHTTGKASIVVAVLDHGIELTHPDMPNIAAKSFDTVNGNSPSIVRGSHGTACAGIVAAARNNNKGVAGVAPGTTLMSVSDPLRLSPNAAQQLADGLNWAWKIGKADVISNSWGHDLLASALIDDAINEALTNGRGGLGAVVVFAAGNANGPVGYPARSNPDILAVGAMSPCAERKNPASCDGETWWGSNYGKEVDVVAPGVLVPTTDRTGPSGYDSGDYAMTFNGTSSACPHVAGVAALILSVDAGLTQKEVAGIIEKSAQKVGGYNYTNTAGRPNGTWHDEMGYGLVDALACVREARGVDPKDSENCQITAKRIEERLDEQERKIDALSAKIDLLINRLSQNVGGERRLELKK